MENNAINQYIDAILGKECSVCPHNAQCEKGLTCDKNKAYSKMIIAGVEWQKQQSPWISLKDRLPRIDECVLLNVESGGLIIVTGDFVANYNRTVFTHWMPIPNIEE